MSRLTVCLCISHRLFCAVCVLATDNAELITDQDIRTRDNYHTVDKAIRYKMSNVSSADGHHQQRKLKEKRGKSRERASLSMISPFAQHEIRISTSLAHSPFSSLSLPVGGHAKSIGKNRPLARLPPLLLQFSLLIVTISRWNIRHFVSDRFVDSVVIVPCPYILIRNEFRIVSESSLYLYVSNCIPWKIWNRGIVNNRVSFSKVLNDWQKV